MKTKTKLSTGEVGEWAAAHFLEELGYTLVDKNWRWGRRGEIDLVMREGDQIVFVEVKTRRSLTSGTALEAVDKRKLRQLRRLGAAWSSENRYRGPYRLDVLGVYLRGGREPIFEWLQDVAQ